MTWTLTGTPRSRGDGNIDLIGQFQNRAKFGSGQHRAQIGITMGGATLGIELVHHGHPASRRHLASCFQIDTTFMPVARYRPRSDILLKAMENSIDITGTSHDSSSKNCRRPRSPPRPEKSVLMARRRLLPREGAARLKTIGFKDWPDVLNATRSIEDHSIHSVNYLMNSRVLR